MIEAEIWRRTTDTICTKITVDGKVFYQSTRLTADQPAASAAVTITDDQGRIVLQAANNACAYAYAYDSNAN